MSFSASSPAWWPPARRTAWLLARLGALLLLLALGRPGARAGHRRPAHPAPAPSRTPTRPADGFGPVRPLSDAPGRPVTTATAALALPVGVYVVRAGTRAVE